MLLLGFNGIGQNLFLRLPGTFLGPNSLGFHEQVHVPLIRFLCVWTAFHGLSSCYPESLHRYSSVHL